MAFQIYNRSRQSLPLEDGAVQGFECDVFSAFSPFYITVERQGDVLMYECFRDREVWLIFKLGRSELKTY
jgi:hypothetical protein